jgi:transaldolase
VTDPTPAPLHDLRAAGVSVWLDDLSRDRLQSGNLADLVATRGVVGVTTNPTIFHAAITASTTYRDDLVALAASGADAAAAVRHLTVSDVQHACDLLAGVAAASAGVDGRVSLEVDPRLAHDGEATLAQARELWQAVDRPNLMIKIPATLPGLPAVTACLAEGISVNVTLIFSLQRYRAVLEAWLAGVEQRLSAGLPAADVVSVASFFVSRVDTEVDARLDAVGIEPSMGLHGRAALANARLAYQAYEQMLASPRWGALAAAGVRPQRPLWASTGVKNPAYPDTLYVTELVAPDTVNTMPQATLEAVAEHGVVRPGSVVEEYGSARATVDALAAAGIDLDDVTTLLEQQGVQKFATSWGDLLAAVEARLQAAR